MDLEKAVDILSAVIDKPLIAAQYVPEANCLLLCFPEGKDVYIHGAFNAVMVNADRLADSVIANCDDWAEGRAFAYALRLSLDKYRQAKLHIPNLRDS